MKNQPETHFSQVEKPLKIRSSLTTENTDGAKNHGFSPTF
jgi:hypothetical protein